MTTRQAELSRGNSREEIDRALKTNAEITAKLIHYAKAQERMIKDLFETIEAILETLDDDSA